MSKKNTEEIFEIPPQQIDIKNELINLQNELNEITEKAFEKIKEPVPLGLIDCLATTKTKRKNNISEEGRAKMKENFKNMREKMLLKKAEEKKAKEQVKEQVKELVKEVPKDQLIPKVTPEPVKEVPKVVTSEQIKPIVKQIAQPYNIKTAFKTKTLW